jgi:hypothetical protein
MWPRMESAMTTKQDDLTPAERRYLEHAQEAQKRGMSLPEYYRCAGLSVYSLYNVRRSLLRKGVICARHAARVTPSTPRAYVAVKVAGASPAASAVVCRLCHPSGWVIECGSWPPAGWMAECFGGDIHAAA